MKQRIFILCFAALLVAQATPVYATLDSFKKTIEEAETEKEAEDKEEKEVKEKKKKSNDSSGSLFDIFFGGLFDIFFYAWAGGNLTINYGPYPYAEEKFIQHPSVDDYYDFDFNQETYSFCDFSKKNHSFSTGLSAFHLGGIGTGSWFSFSGNIFKFFGPYLDAYMITDTKQILGGGRAGLHFSLIQSNFYNLACYAQWQGWGGTLSRNSFVTGLDTRLYPVKPLSIRFKAGFQLFENLSISELEGEICVMLKAWEFYIGYRYWGLTDEHFATSPWHGPYLGIRTYF